MWNSRITIDSFVCCNEMSYPVVGPKWNRSRFAKWQVSDQPVQSGWRLCCPYVSAGRGNLVRMWSLVPSALAQVCCPSWLGCTLYDIEMSKLNMFDPGQYLEDSELYLNVYLLLGWRRIHVVFSLLFAVWNISKLWFHVLSALAKVS